MHGRRFIEPNTMNPFVYLRSLFKKIQLESIILRRRNRYPHMKRLDLEPVNEIFFACSFKIHINTLPLKLLEDDEE